MDYDIATDCDHRIVCVAVNAPVTYDLACRFSVSALEEARARGFYRFLVDLRGTRSQENAVNQYLFVQELPKFGLTKSFSVAVVIDEGDQSREFVTTLVQRRAMSLRLFHDPVEAQHWLAKQPG